MATRTTNFNPCGWITDMAGSNIEGLKRFFGTDVVGQIKSCKFHLKEFIIVSHESLVMKTAATLNVYESYEDLESFIAECPERLSLSTWLDWWKPFVFPAFIGVSENEPS